MSSHVKQILIAGAGTAAWWNAGDEAILYAMVGELRAQYPGVRIGVVSANPKGTLGVYKVREIPASEIQTLIEFAKQSDLLILGGGGLFYDYWGFAVDNLLTENQGGAGIYVGFAMLATLLNKPLMIYAVGVGPLFFDTGKHYTRLTFEQAQAITVRDSESKELLISLGIVPEKIQVTADPVWGFPEIPIDLSESLIQSIGLNASSPVLGVSVRPWTNPLTDDAWANEVARALDDFIQKNRGTVIFIPFHKNDGSVDDYAQSQKIHRLMKYADSAHILDADISLEKKVSVLRRCDLMLGMRLHANILAMRYGIPAIGLAYDPKVTNLFNEASKPDYVLDLRFFSAESLYFVLEQAFKERETLRGFYAKTAESMYALAKENVALTERLTRNNQPSNSPLPVDTFQWVKSLLLEHTSRISGRLSSLNQQIAEQQAQIDFLNSQLDSIKNTFSWKITLPIRFLRMFFQNPRESLLKLFKYLWVRLPGSSQPWTQRLKRRITVFFQKMRSMTPDLTWEEFQSGILASSGNYKGIFILYSTIDWNFPFAQRPKPLCVALAKLGYLIIYHTPNHIDRVYDVRQVAQNIWITSTNIGNIEAKDAVHSVYSTSLTTPPDILTNKRKQNQILVYEYIDHVSPMISGEGGNIHRLLELKKFAFNGGADFIIASARQLEQEAVKAMGREKVIYVPNGVDVQHYREPLQQEIKLPETFTAFRERYQTLVGYFGAIAPWLWHDMIDELTQLRLDLGFVFIGPDYNNGVAHFPKSPNMLYLDGVDYKVLPAYARLFDVCLIPFAPGEIARTTSPLKLFEYFALEKPVVVTSFMDECMVYDEVFSGDSAQSISVAIDEAVEVKDDPEYRARLALLAEQNSWDERAKSYEAVYFPHRGIQPDDTHPQDSSAGG